ncbi:WD repeat-containing protein 64-like [Heptranchias perlo]|uniref:WD repeat-containing protein 64-like n=1 Tax=Heptranchias perlo TaxID=212740 RepID=UPI003559DF40
MSLNPHVNANLQSCFQMKLQTNTNIGDISQVTGCDYLSQLKRIITVTETSIVIWDHKPKSKNQTNFFTLKPMKNILLCICTVILSEYMNEDCLLIGDDAGFVNLIIVGSEDLNLQKSKESDALQSQVMDPRFLRRPILRRKLHNDWVLKVKYFAHLNYFACCSPDSEHSVVLDDIRKLGDCQPIRTLSIPRGVNAFDYCVRANTIVTGGGDKIIRLWNPTMFSKPKAMLFGHNCIIIEIVINEADQHIISLSTEGMFRVWDVQTLAVLQVFMGERKADRHFNTMVFDSKNKRLITGSTVIDVLPLTSAVQDIMQVPLSHDRSINVLVYNRIRNVLISICSKSIIKMWELYTGKKLYQIPHPHGQAIEVTAAAVDQSGQYLITGAFDGSLIIWEFLTGEKIKSLPPITEGSEEDQSIFQLAFLKNDVTQLILAVGWNNRIKIIQVSKFTTTFIWLSYFQHLQYFAFETSKGALKRMHSISDSLISPKDGPDDSNLFVLEEFPDIAASVHINSYLFLRKQSQSSSGQSNSGKEDYLTGTGLSCFDVINLNDENILAIGWLSVIMVWNIESASIMKVFNEELISDTTDGFGKQDFLQDVELSKVQVVKFLVHKIQKIETEISGSMYYDIIKDDDIKLNFGRIMPYFCNSQICAFCNTGIQLEKVLPTLQFSNPITTVYVNDNAKILLAGNQRLGKPNSEMEVGSASSSSHAKEFHPLWLATAKDMDPDNILAQIVKNLCTIIHRKLFQYSCDIGIYLTMWKIAQFYSWLLQKRRKRSILISFSLDYAIEIILEEKAHALRIDVLTLENVYLETVYAIAFTAYALDFKRGYIIIWDIEAFLDDPYIQNKEPVNRIISWKAHTLEIVSLFYVEENYVVVSASTDCSVRVWYARNGHYIGYFGQHSPLLLSDPSEFVLPNDITEAPVETKSKKSDKSDLLDYPLMLDWESFSGLMPESFEIVLSFNLFAETVPLLFGIGFEELSDISLQTNHTEAGFQWNLKTTTALIDLSTVYDMVWRCVLLLKTSRVIKSCSTMRLLATIFINCRYRVLFNGKISKAHTLNDGLFQGSMLAPSLFNIYINDLPNTILCTFINADDIALVTQGKVLTTIGESLSTVLKVTAEYFQY